MFQLQKSGWSITLLKKTFVVAVAIAVFASSARADLYIRDDLPDTGVEPNPSSGPMWVSPDIWVRNDPLPGWNPRPYDFTLPVGSSGGPPTWVDATNFNPDYRSPLSGKPNWAYVRIRNKGAASTGTERLQLYWASASTGLSWDPLKVGGSFVDNVQNVLGKNVLFGSEITKVRKNAANATPTELNAYIAALRKIATDPALSWASLGGVSYWRTQQEIHRFGPTYRHGFNGSTTWVPSVAFLPWHREFINRFEGLLQEADPTVKLLYWQWTNRPVPPFTGGTAPFLDYSANFMGAFGAGASAAVQIGAPLSPDIDPGYANAFNGLSKVTRRLQPPGNPLAESDTTVLNRIPYDATSANTAFSGGLESVSHNNSHVYIASTGSNAIVGDQLFQPYAGRDPFFYLLHAKVDELWARWQRKDLNNLDPATTFSNVNVPMSTIGLPMGPWDGTLAGPDGLSPSVTTLHPTGSLEPWSVAGGQLYAKQGDDRSVTSPPFYDTAPLTIPALQNNQEVILEIPWYPPNPAGFGAITDPQHVCLIARIETSTSAPFGMTVAETSSINFNTQQNNNIAWRNVSVVDSFPGPFKSVRFLLANGFRQPVVAGLRLGAKLNQPGPEFFERGSVRVDLGPDLLKRWRGNGARASGCEATADGQLRLTQGNAVLEGIELKPGERFPVRLFFDLKRDYRPTKPGENMIFDVVQTGTPRDPGAIIGGQRYQIAVDKLTPVERGRTWRWLPGTKRVPDKWTSITFDDSGWFERKLDLGWVEPPGTANHSTPTAASYYFRYAFEVEDPGFFRSLLMRIKRSDGAIVYLNEKEVYRENVDGSCAPSTSMERSVYFPVKLDPALLRPGRNVIAVEIRRAEANHGALTFDLELNANAESTQQAPYVQLANVTDGTLMTVGRTASIDADALKFGGLVRSVTLIVDNKPVQTLGNPPFSFKWRVQPGSHRMSVTVTDSDGLQSNAYATVTGVKNVPPVVELTQPSQHMQIAEGDVLVAVARANDPDGRIAKVDFYVHDSYVIGAPGRLVSTALKSPFTATLRNLKKGHAMIVAVATDDGGARTASIPVMVIVADSGPHAGHRTQ